MSLSVSIEKKLGAFALKVSFETDKEILALLGASGSGKSLTLQCIAGVLKPDKGRIVLNGRVLFDSDAGVDLPPQQRRVGMLFQDYALFPNMTALQNLCAALHGLPKRERLFEARRLLAAFRLSAYEKTYPARLSGGERQRLALARALAAKPELLLLDEPFSALDEHLKWQLELFLNKTLQGFAGDVLFVSHSRDEVCRLCTRVCVLSNGRSEPVLRIEDMMRRPGSVGAALLSGCKNVSPIERLDKNRLRCENWGFELQTAAPIGDEITCVGIRAHSLRLGDGENALDCTVERVIDNVFSYILMLQTPGGGLLRLERDKTDFAPPQVGAPLRCCVRAEDIMLLTGEMTP